MAKEFIFGWMEENTKEITKMMCLKDKDYFFGIYNFLKKYVESQLNN